MGNFTFARNGGGGQQQNVLLINLASILIVYDYCVPVQMVMQMAMGAMQVCVSVQTLFINLAILWHLSRVILFILNPLHFLDHQQVHPIFSISPDPL